MMNKLKLAAWFRSAITGENKYTALQKLQYRGGTSDHQEHNDIQSIGIFYLVTLRDNQRLGLERAP